MATYSRYELDSMPTQLEEQMNRFIDTYNERYPGDIVAPPLEYADLKSKIADYYREVAEIDRWAKQTVDEATETGWLYDTPMDNDVKLFAGIGINTKGKWKVDRAGVVREFTSKEKALEWANSYGIDFAFACLSSPTYGCPWRPSGPNRPWRPHVPDGPRGGWGVLVRHWLVNLTNPTPARWQQRVYGHP